LARQCAAVSTKSPVRECRIDPVQLCTGPSPRNTAPIDATAATGCAVAVDVGLVATCASG